MMLSPSHTLIIKRMPFAARTALGLLLVIVVRELCKPMLLAILHPLFQAMPLPLRRRMQPPISTLYAQVGQEGTDRALGVALAKAAKAAVKHRGTLTGVLLKKDGSAWDVDVTRRYLQYALTTAFMVEYRRLCFVHDDGIGLMMG